MTRDEILAGARQAVMVDRAATHGEAEQSFALIAALWSALLGVDIAPHQVALMLAQLKAARAWGNPGHGDNWVDLAGYAACGGEIARRSSSDRAATDSAPEAVHATLACPECGLVPHWRVRSGHDLDGLFCACKHSEPNVMLWNRWVLSQTPTAGRS